MKSEFGRIKDLSESLAETIEREKSACREIISSIAETLKLLQSSSNDKRFQRLSAQLKKLQERLDLLAKTAREDFLSKIDREAETLKNSLSDGRAAQVLNALAELQTPSLNLFCETLLDRLIEATKAERGFIVSYIPESTEADVIAARNYQTKNLSLEEYGFSRSLLQEIFHTGGSLLVNDALNDASYSKEASVRNFQLRSVAAAALKRNGRVIGALYVANDKVPHAFAEEDLALLESSVRFTLFYLQHARLLPILFERESRVFFDPSRASREIVGRDRKTLALLEAVDRIADSNAAVLLEGESGTGKELVARALHYQSRRRDRPFIAINCAAIPDNLLESELFGYERGAFTGAVERYSGRIEQATGGTVFLDEISEMAYPLQAKLLRFLQSNEFQRLGGKDVVQANVRIVAATSKDLKSMMKDKKFQDALYYRINVIPLRMPALRERKEDIPLLADHFLSKFCAMYERNIQIEEEVYEHLKEHSFPGNVRELENLIHRLVVLSAGASIRLGDLPEEILRIAPQRVDLKRERLHEILYSPPADIEELRCRREEIKQLFADQESMLINEEVRKASGNLTEAANRLGVHRVTLHRIVRRNKSRK